MCIHASPAEGQRGRGAEGQRARGPEGQRGRGAEGQGQDTGQGPGLSSLAATGNDNPVRQTLPPLLSWGLLVLHFWFPCKRPGCHLPRSVVDRGDAESLAGRISSFATCADESVCEAGKVESACDPPSAKHWQPGSADRIRISTSPGWAPFNRETHLCKPCHLKIRRIIASNLSPGPSCFHLRYLDPCHSPTLMHSTVATLTRAICRTYRASTRVLYKTYHAFTRAL